MASDESFVDYVRDQTSGVGKISFRKMFGEYAMYCGTKVVALICDNQLFVRPTAAGRALLESVVEAPPYRGAKPHFLVSETLDDAQSISRLIVVTERELPEPKVKAKSKRGAKVAKTSKKRPAQKRAGKRSGK